MKPPPTEGPTSLASVPSADLAAEVARRMRQVDVHPVYVQRRSPQGKAPLLLAVPADLVPQPGSWPEAKKWLEAGKRVRRVSAPERGQPDGPVFAYDSITLREGALVAAVHDPPPLRSIKLYEYLLTWGDLEARDWIVVGEQPLEPTQVPLPDMDAGTGTGAGSR